jgi:hypothetical protein
MRVEEELAMLNEAQKMAISNILRPASPPRELDGVYTDDQLKRMLAVVHGSGPWDLIIAQHFASAEELVATMSGGFPPGVTPQLDWFLTPTFRGHYAQYSACLFPEIDDCFYNSHFLSLAKSYWNADYAKPEKMLFNVNGPCGNTDPGHLDSPSFRGVRYENAPTWLCSVMGKSGLFRDHLIKMAQVIAWFSHDGSSGFTYWPEGPRKDPQRVQPPIYNRGVLVQNEMMVHRGEANGPLSQQRPQGLSFATQFRGEPGNPEGWQAVNGQEVIASYHTDDLRFLVHWSAEVFADYTELKKNMEHTDDLSFDQVFETLIRDCRARGIAIETPTDPMHDTAFITALNAAYDFGGPRTYPAEAPVTPIYAEAA